MWWRASVEMKMAPTPMGPNQPLNRASRNVLMSGIHLYNARMAGKRRNSRIKMVMTIRRHTDNPYSLKSWNGMIAPM